MMHCYCHSDGTAASEVTVDDPDAVICTSKYSRDAPFTMGRVVFPVTNDRSDSYPVDLVDHSCCVYLS